MKTLIIRLCIVIATLAVGTTAFGSTVRAAGSGVLYLSPSGGTHTVGQTFALSVYEDGKGSPVSDVNAVLVYNAAQLQYTGASCAGAFSSAQGISGGNGSITINCFTPGGSTIPTAASQVATVSFKALSSGSATVSFDGASYMASNGTDVWNGVTAGGTYSLVAPAPTPTPKPAPVQTPKSTGSSTSTSTTGTDNNSDIAQVKGTSTTDASTSNTSDSTKKAASAPKQAATTASKNTSNKVTWIVSLLIILIAAVAAFWYSRKATPTGAKSNPSTEAANKVNTSKTTSQGKKPAKISHKK